MVCLQNQKSFPIHELNECDKSISTLLIPEHLYERLSEKVKLHGNRMPVYLRNLLKMFRIVTHSGLIPSPRKIKTEYQEQGLLLKRVNFRVFNEDWLELGELALAFGKSRCWMFVFLLELDLSGLWEVLSEFGLGQGVPTKNNLRLKSSWSLERFSHNFSRSYHVRI